MQSLHHFYLRDLRTHGFWYPQGTPKIPRTTISEFGVINESGISKAKGGERLQERRGYKLHQIQQPTA